MSEDRDDITRYLSNQMNDRERHAFEKRMLNDPFLAEAVEGAETIRPEEFREDLQSLEQRLASRREYAWSMTIRIAAGVVLVFVVGWLAYRETPPPPESLALKKPDSTSLPTGDSSGQLLTMANPATSQPESTPAGDQPRQSRAERTPADTNSLASTSGALARREPIETESKTGIGVDAAQPQAQAVHDAAKELAISEESPSAKSAAAPSRSQAGKAVTADEKSRKDVSFSSLLIVPSPNSDFSAKTFETLPLPSGGIDNYRQYLDRGKRIPESAQAAAVSGTVVIDFVVNESGAVSQFTTIQSIGFGCEEEVRRLIKEGPAWQPAIVGGKPAAATVRVSVTF